ncbi:2,4-dihydroxyhept-2-ene-1,7-dioic acid aldolase [Phaeobacter italicus]|uniref:HpcH/HpaI aldolase family protein n=1 Tax=Phaeobacter italicus TaxID=481446 RepID=UPI001ADAE6D8|nr:aldolase/citrate lyase family protein [Phaeobacter italicus]MBO9443887.1 2,4-dihydroxyhept-2-ene-1,7-dioic acid aldolase [Phaeobacter italicus]
MIKNTLKKLWADGQPALNGWLSIGNPFTAEIMAAQDYDSITIDMQHGALDYSATLPMLQAMRASGKTLMARVPWNDPGIIMKALDAGAYGIICPMINSRAEAEAFVSSMRYPPLGNRSFGPTRVNFAAGAGYADEANGEMLAIAMIETREAIENLQEIVTTPGLDAIYIGPADLTLGAKQGELPPGFDREEPEMLALIQRILQAAKDADIRACLHCGTPEYAARAIGWGFDLTTISGDSRLLASAASSSVAKARTLLGAQAKSDEKTGGY